MIEKCQNEKYNQPERHLANLFYLPALMNNREKGTYDIIKQQTPRSACILMQSDQGLHCYPLTKSLDSEEYISKSKET